MRAARALARRVAADHLAILEVHLSPPRAVPDLSVLVKEPAEMAAMAEAVPPPARPLLRRWAGRLDPRIASLWLELDLTGAEEEEEPAQVPVPSLCVKLRETADPRWVLGRLLPELNGGPLTPWQEERAARCLAAIPGSGQLLYVFNLLPRGGDLRLEIYGLSGPEMAAYLERIGAPVPGDEVRGVATLLAGSPRTHLSFDLGPAEVRPRIGIESSFARLPRREPRWEEMLGRFVERGLCSAEQKAALLAWPGWDSFWTAPDLWPRDPARMDVFCIRYLSHLKMVYQPGRPLGLKAYLACGPYRRRRRGGAREGARGGSR